MKSSSLTVLVAGLIIASCQAPAEKQYFSESPEIDLGKKVVEAYLVGNWEAYSEFYSDTARIYRNVNWQTNDGFTLEEYIEDLKTTLEPISEYRMDEQVWHMMVTDDGERLVMFAFVWIGQNDATNKEYEIPVFVGMRVVDNEIVVQVEFYNEAEFAMDMMALAGEAEEAEDEDEDEDEDDDQ